VVPQVVVGQLRYETQRATVYFDAEGLTPARSPAA
jgi:hypothetical protein